MELIFGPRAADQTTVRTASLRYRLLDLAGNDLGALASRRTDWRPGERLARAQGGPLEVVNVVESEDPRFRGYIVVRPHPYA